jgi:hypothetical protein
VAWNVPFAGIQLLLGVGLLVPRTARLTLGASIVWALGVWYLAEGLSGMADGHASLIDGAPGSALIYAILAAAAWAVLWVGAALFQALPGQNSGKAVASALTGGAGALVRRTRVPAVALGLALALVFWVLGQDLGALYTGQATDPNSGPLLALMAIALLSGGTLRMRGSGAAPGVTTRSAEMTTAATSISRATGDTACLPGPTGVGSQQPLDGGTGP